MSSTTAQPLRRQLILVIALLIAPTLFAAAWLAMGEFEETSGEFAEATEAAAMRAAADIFGDLITINRRGMNLSSHPDVRNLAPAAVSLLRDERLRHPSILELTLIDLGGAVIATSGTGRVQDDWRAAVARVARTDGHGMATIVPDEGPPYAAVSYPVRTVSGEHIGVLTYYIDPQVIQEGVDKSSLPEGSVVVIADDGGRVIARNLEPDLYRGRVVDPTWRNEPAAAERAGLDGVRRIFARAVVGNGPWLVVIGIPVVGATERAVSVWLRTLPVLALTLGGWLLIAFVATRRLTRSVGHLEAAAKRIAAGDFSPLDSKPMPTREFAELQNAFDQMLVRFNETRQALDDQMAEERQMRQEVESLQRQVIRQERLAAVGQLVSGVAHEINNPLQAILGFAELLQMQRDIPNNVRNDLVLIQKESARACAIIRNLAMFARQQTAEAEPVLLGDVIRSVAELRQRRLESEGIELRIEDTSTRHVEAVMTELQQVVLNFVVNAEQAIVLSKRQPGRITVRAYDRDDRAVLEVEDTGPGVPPDHEARLFQPFFTTKPVGQGTGLGLSVSYGIIDSLGGHIGYRNAPAGGAVFFFDLPATR